MTTATVNVRILRTMVRYLQHEVSPADAAAFLDDIGVDEAFLADENHWIDYPRYAAAWEALERRTGDPTVAVRVGRFTISKPNLGSVWALLRAAGMLGGGTAAGYRFIPRVANQVTHLGRFEVEAVERTSARVRWVRTDGVPFTMTQCLYRQGILSAGPRLADLPPATVQEIGCIGRGDASCTYAVGFAADRAVAGQRLGALVGAVAGIGVGGAGLGWMAGLATAVACWAVGRARDLANQLRFTTGTMGDQVEQLLEAKTRLEREYALLSATQQTLREKEQLASLGELSARVAHELRNPLGVIKASAQVLADPTKPEAVRQEVTGFIVDEVDRMAAALTNLLVFARPKTSHRAATDVRALLERVALEWSTRPEPRAQVRVVAGVSPVSALVDPHQLHQVLVNLLLNASEATGGAGTLTMTVAVVMGHVELTIDDDGPGFSDEARARAFEPFFTTKPNGTGLGLTNVRQMVEGNEGTVAIERSPFGGARVRLTLEAASPS